MNDSVSNWNSENTYWRENYSSRPYYNRSRNYSVYEPAYRYGVDLYSRNPGRSFEDLSQSDLNSGWSSSRGTSDMDWQTAEPATRDAYNRLYNNNRANMNNSLGNTSPAAR